MRPFVSPATRFVDWEGNATKRPSHEIDENQLTEFPSAPDESTLARSVVPVHRSWTKMSELPFVSPATRSGASLMNATNRPSADSVSVIHGPDPSAPLESTQTIS